MERTECVVIGAGVIGLAIGRAIARAGREVYVLEAAEQVGTHSSSRNSEVIHAGIYYPPGSLKARLCVAGKKKLYEYCRGKNVGCKRIGKLIVASSTEEISDLERYRENARACGVDDLEWLNPTQMHELEPQVQGAAALFSHTTGIIDSHEYMQALQGDLEAAGGQVVLNTRVVSVRPDAAGFSVQTLSDGTIETDTVINAAGAGAQKIAHGIEQYDTALIPSQSLVRGQYYTYSAPSPFRHLVYPLARKDSLGIHVTLDLAGQARFGPDAVAVSSLDYSFDDSRRSIFESAIRAYFPELDAGALQPGYTGIRAALEKAGPQQSDFAIHGPAEHGMEGLVNLFGIESPGLTASLEIADLVMELLQQKSPAGAGL